MEATSFDHNLVVMDEFDALSIEFREPEPKLEPLSAKPSGKYPAKIHARKVAKELGAQNGIIYLPGQLEATWEDSDQGPPFRQRRYFYYLAGVNFPGCSVTYDIAADKLTLWIPFTPPATVLWFGNTPSIDDCLERTDVHDVKYVSELSAYLGSRLSTVKKLYALRISQLPKFDGFDKLKSQLRIDTTMLQTVMDEARVTKSDYEVAMIRKANALSSAAHKLVAMRLSTMVNECQIESAFVAACTAQNAHTQAYPVIAGSGVNASTLHYESNNESLAGRQVVVLDAGAEWECYASDITRTLPIGPTFSPEARAIYDLVHQMQEECIQRIKPGVVFRSLQLHATLVAVKGLLQLGILRNGTADEIFKSGTGAAFFPHGLGHHVGLDVHDVLSRELLRPASEGMWGKRRPVGPQTIRAMIKQAANDTNGEDSPPATPTSASPAPAPASSTSKTVSSSSSPSAASSPPNGSRRRPHQRQNTPPLPMRRHDTLRPNMVVTVEPGLYFCRPYIEAYFLRNDEHRRFINPDVLARYWDVGGVRIEDCILVTRDGYENLTTAPKGEELLRIAGVAGR
ncbi:metallopeptidase family M24-domain-containing protein [Biscogniauxia sp. FL1348]|nr:metallopeptidase family M24-domain-containing protein [Biscogniauxia sp. FL1348]